MPGLFYLLVIKLFHFVYDFFILLVTFVLFHYPLINKKRILQNELQRQ